LGGTEQGAARRDGSRATKDESAHRVDTADEEPLRQGNRFPMESFCRAVARMNRASRIKLEGGVFDRIEIVFVQIIRPSQIRRTEVEPHTRSQTGSRIEEVVPRIPGQRRPKACGGLTAQLRNDEFG